MSLAWATITRWVMCPLMSRPRMSWARALASSGLSASLTPPALPRPPTFTCALTTTVWPMSRAIDSASSGVSATPPGSTGTPCEANKSRAWYSKRSTNRHRSSPVTTPRLRALKGQGPGGGHHRMPHSIGPLTLPAPARSTRLDDEEPFRATSRHGPDGGRPGRRRHGLPRLGGAPAGHAHDRRRPPPAADGARRLTKGPRPPHPSHARGGALHGAERTI